MYSSSAGILTLIFGIAGGSLALAQEVEEPRKFHISGDVVCRLQKDPTLTHCPELKHFNLGLRTNVGERFSLSLSWDPGQVNKPTWTDSAEVLGQRLPPRKTWFSHYALRWRFRPAVEISVEDWSAATLLPDASGLSFAQILQDSGWNQSVLRLSFIDSEGPQYSWSLIAGLGEGERFKEQDHKPYLGIVGRREIIPALEWQAGWSLDTDSQEKANFYWLDESERNRASAGFKTQRQALSFILNGQHPKARGLRLALGIQRNLIQGPKKFSGVRLVEPSEGPFDPTEILAENWGQHSDLERRTLAISGSYLILAEYLLGFHWQRLDVALGSGATVNSCSQLDTEGSCIDAHTDRRHLIIQEHSWGIGRMSDEGWGLFLESFTINYDRLYELYHFAPVQNRRQRSTSIAQLRLSWTW